MRIGFFGTPDLASQVLQDLMGASDIEVAFVVTNPDKPFGRDQSMRPSAVKIVSTEYNIPTYTPEKIR